MNPITVQQAISHNFNIQKRNHPDTEIAQRAVLRNEELFAHCEKMGWKYKTVPGGLTLVVTLTESDYRNFGEEQGRKWDEGYGLDCLVKFKHKGTTIINPYSHTIGDPADMFGAKKMAEWKSEAAALMKEWLADNGIEVDGE